MSGSAFSASGSWARGWRPTSPGPASRSRCGRTPRARRSPGPASTAPRSATPQPPSRRASDIVVSMVVDGPQVESVLLGPGGVAEGAAAGLLCVDMSTISPRDTRRIGAALGERGLALVDAPGDRLVAPGAGRNAHDHGRRRRGRRRARPAAARDDGLARRARRGARPGRDGQGRQQRARRGQRERARGGARARRGGGRRRRRAPGRRRRRIRRLDDARAEGRSDAPPRLLDAVQDRAHAQGRTPVPGGRRGARRPVPRRLARPRYACRDRGARPRRGRLRRHHRGRRGARRRRAIRAGRRKPRRPPRRGKPPNFAGDLGFSAGLRILLTVPDALSARVDIARERPV